MAPSNILLSYFREAGFEHAIRLRDFCFSNTPISIFVERWHSNTHTFYLSWDGVPSHSRM
ncbi:hypothetical protein AHAS_Ahas17G0158100 [Arachis hypogaea]